MTQEERIKKLENEISVLKDELKKTRKANVWKRVKENFRSKLESFNWVYEYSFMNADGEGGECNRSMTETGYISQAIGTIVRVTLKRRGLNYLEDSDEEKAIEITKQILEIMEKERRN